MSENNKAISDRLADIMTWLREPDWTEKVSLEWLRDWMDRRPIAELAMVAMLMPGPGGQSMDEAAADNFGLTADDLDEDDS